MKHAVNRSKTTVKAKSKTLTQIKAVKKINSAAQKKPTGKIAAASRPKAPAQKAKPATAAKKIEAKSLPARAGKPAIKTTASKLSAKTLNALKTPAAKRKTAAVGHTAKPKTKKVAAKILIETAKTTARKSKPVSTTRKITAVEKAAKKPATKKIKLETATAKSKVVATSRVKTSVKATKPQTPKTAATAKPRRPKTEAPPPKTKNIHRNAKPVAAKKPKIAAKTKVIVAPPKPAKRKRVAPPIAPKTVNRKLKKDQLTVAVKKPIEKIGKTKPAKATAKNAAGKTAKLKLIVAGKGGAKKLKSKPAIAAAPPKRQSGKIRKSAVVKKIKTIETVIEKIAAPKPKNRKARPISSAVFRGKKERYDFKVFDLREKLEPIPAVYIISKRKTDRHKRGHHALICIGETASIADELKRHRKGKCVKKHEANVVSILPEADQKTRLRIETDLKAAHNVACNFD